MLLIAFWNLPYKISDGEGGNQNPANLGPDFYEKSFV
jgi:hypothetical protein